jgi:hypothetical protein
MIAFLLVLSIPYVQMSFIHAASSGNEILYSENFETKANGDRILDVWGHVWGSHCVGPYLDRAKTFVKDYRYSGIYSYMKTMYGKGITYEWAAACDNFLGGVYWGFAYPTGEVYKYTALIALTWTGQNDLRLGWQSNVGEAGYKSFPVAYVNNEWVKFKLVTYLENNNIDLYVNDVFVGTATSPDYAKDAIGGYFVINGFWGYIDAIDDVTFYMTPSQQVASIIATIKTWNLPIGTENSLVSKLQNAIQSFNMEQQNAARNKLNAFINEAQAQSNKKLSIEQANMLILKAQNIIDNN